MRIWSIHPQYLDTKGLVALWRETLLAKHVLEGKTRGYLNHPQLDRFKTCKAPLDAINAYLSVVYDEATNRDYNFNATKFKRPIELPILTVTKGQVNYEWDHLLKKLKVRDQESYSRMQRISRLKTHPIFKVVNGDVENWEITK